MEVRLIADAHDHMPKIRRAVGCFNDMGVEYILHAGDFIAPSP